MPPAISSAPAALSRPTARHTVTSSGRDVDALTRQTGLTLRAGLDLGAWQRIGQRLSAVADSTPWWLGDWLIYGEEAYPNRYQQAIATTRLEYQTLRNYAWVCRRFAASRRRDSLSFQHHMEVAKLPPELQDQWLSQAEQHKWSRNRLRRELRTTTQARAGTVRLNITEEQRHRWCVAAETRDLTLAGWISEVLDAAAGPTTTAET